MNTSNQLIHEKSPYLIQHAHNPVNWHPWGNAAFSLARTLDKPVFLSVGYATCHWCHVMERESFENLDAARLLNETFVCIKVDREERPDIDAVYMAACQILSGRGGWPLTVFLTPDKKPFFAATYIPLNGRFGQPGIKDLCVQIKNLWESQRQKISEAVEDIEGYLRESFLFSSSDTIDNSPVEAAYSELSRRFDHVYGGFESAPKFPSPHRFLFLLYLYRKNNDPKALEMVQKTLLKMRCGGIWDHVGFGFHRYSTDRQWLLPHFEKMLYDQAMLALAYLETYRITRNSFYARTAREIFAYVIRDMTSQQGGFFTAEDADSEGEEGKFYVWTMDEFQKSVKYENIRWETILNITQGGNFRDEASGIQSGNNIIHLNQPLSDWAFNLGIPESDFFDLWESVRVNLFDVRSQRVHPLKDDKILTDWNGLMIAALATGAVVLDEPEYAEIASKAADFILSALSDSDGKLLHRFRDGDAAVSAHADDYAFMIAGLLSLHEASDDAKWLNESIRLQAILNDNYLDKVHGGFFKTEDNHDLPVRPKEVYDGAIPSANSASLANLATFYRLTGDKVWLNQAEYLARSFFGTVKAQPSAFTFFITGLDTLC